MPFCGICCESLREFVYSVETVTGGEPIIKTGYRHQPAVYSRKNHNPVQVEWCWEAR